MTEVFSQLCAERLAKGHPNEKLTRAVEKSVKLRRAHRRKRDEILIQHARELAEGVGLQEPSTQQPDERPAPGHDAPAGKPEECPAAGHVLEADGASCQTMPAVMETERPARVDQPGEIRSPGRVLGAVYENVQLTDCPGVPDLKLVQRGADAPLNSRLRFNPKTRLATPAQKEELKRRDGYGCCVPGCPNCLYLEAHHLVEYSAGGPTEWTNLRMACWTCHRNVQKGILIITRNSDGTLTFQDRDGRDLQRTRDIQIAGWLDTWHGWVGRESDCHRGKVEGEPG